jgi:hypothetical protein
MSVPHTTGCSPRRFRLTYNIRCLSATTYPLVQSIPYFVKGNVHAIDSAHDRLTLPVLQFIYPKGFHNTELHEVSWQYYDDNYV